MKKGIDDNETATTAAISSYITSAEFDIEGWSQVRLVSKVLPDITFDGSTADSPVASLSLFPLPGLWFRLQQP